MRHLLVIAAAVLSLHAAFAEDSPSPKQLEREIYESFAKKDYSAAAERCRKLLEVDPKSVDAHYNLACALARSSDKDGAIKSLTQAVDLGYNDAGHMGEDEDLESLRNDERFVNLSEKVREKEKSAPYEKGAEIEGTKIVENYPDGGLRYRLRMSPTETEKPARLIVWLHPSGGSMNNVVEALSPILIKHGFALLVVTKKQWMGWTGPEQELLLNKTLPDLAKVKGLSLEKPILMGFSAGGQAALMMWQANLSKFGGLVLDAAYPIDMEQYSQGKVAALTLPKDDGIKATPFFVLVGDKDNGSQMWKKVESDWRTAGVPLTLRFVPDGVHQWLFGKSQTEELVTWLDQIAQGKTPADPAK